MEHKLIEGTMEPICKEVKVQLTGKNGNAYFIIGHVQRAMKKAKISTETIAAFRNEAMAGDYDNLLRTCMKYVEVS